MFQQGNDFDELGRKVQQAREQLEQVRGVGTVDGVRVIVDADGRLLSVSLPQEHSVLAAYEAALADAEPLVEYATRALSADPRYESISTFVEANAAHAKAHREQQQRDDDEEDDHYYEERNRNGWLES